MLGRKLVLEPGFFVSQGCWVVEVDTPRDNKKTWKYLKHASGARLLEDVFVGIVELIEKALFHTRSIIMKNT